MKEVELSENISCPDNILIKSSVEKKYKKLFLSILKLIILLAFLYFISTRIDFRRFINSFKSVNLILISAASLLVLINIFLQYKKWGIVCDAFKLKETKQAIFFSLLYGFTAGIFTPARLGEFFGRKLMLKNKSIVKITSATFLDKLFPMFTLSILGFPIFIYYLKYVNYIGADVFYVLIISFAVLLILLILFLLKGKAVARVYLNKVMKFITRGKYGINIFEGISGKVILKLLLVSALFLVCYTIQFALLFSAFSLNSNFIICLVIAFVVMFSKSFVPQISVGDLGIRESAAVFFFTKVGGTAEAALSASLFLFILNLFLPSFLGFIISYKKVNA
jgi:uncharacterized membrane protein YbhN (UPF0104 family)